MCEIYRNGIVSESRVGSFPSHRICLPDSFDSILLRGLSRRVAFALFIRPRLLWCRVCLNFYWTFQLDVFYTLWLYFITNHSNTSLGSFIVSTHLLLIYYVNWKWCQISYNKANIIIGWRVVGAYFKLDKVPYHNNNKNCVW